MNGSVVIRGWHVLTFLALNMTTVVAFSFWVGAQAKQISVNTERLTKMEGQLEANEKRQAAQDRETGQVIQRLNDLYDQLREQHRERLNPAVGTR